MIAFVTRAGPEWQQLALYAVVAAILLMLLQQAPFQPALGRIVSSLGLDRQQVSGKEVRIRLAPDGHFWANATINGVPRRMLIDSGATVSGLSGGTAISANIDADSSLVPIVMQTANGVTHARTGTIRELRLGNIVARDLKVVTSPGLGVDILGMNFLSKLQSWRVENNILILTPHHPQEVGEAR